MTPAEPAMKVAGLWRYPVKSMEGARLDACAVTPAGIPGDRAWALVERATGKALSAKRWPKLMLCRARYADEPGDGAVGPALMTLPGGESVRTDEPRAASLLSEYLGVDCVPALDPGRHFDDRPLHLIADSTLRAFRYRTFLDFDVLRFRPNILIAVPGDAVAERDWVGRRLRAGAVEIDIAKDTKRCVMTTLPQPGLTEARGILPAIAKEGAALGVYGAAVATGRLAVGDDVIL
jgi:uncharacterized protein YcbX